MNGWLQDLRFAWRMLMKSPGFTAVVVIAMGLGIGVNASIYTIVRGVMLRQLPFPESERIVAVEATSSRPGENEPFEMSDGDFLDVRDRAKSFSALGASTETQIYTSLGSEPERFNSTYVTPGVLPALGVKPLMGRWFNEQEGIEGNQYSSVILSHRIWTKRLNSDPHVLGRTFRMNGRIRTVVGVMPPGFQYPEIADFFTPMAFKPNEISHGSHYLTVVGRLKPGVTVDAARSEVRTLAAAIAKENPKTNDVIRFTVTPLREQFSRGAAAGMWMLSAAVLFVLLIACANVANLMLARAATRHREMSLRIALGAGRGRIVRQLLTESVLIALIGGTLGYFIAYWMNDFILSTIPIEMPFWMNFDFDAQAVMVTAAISVGSGLIFGLAPAFQFSSRGLYEALKEGGLQGGVGRGHQRLRNGLVVAEVALAMVLLIGSGLMIRSFLRMQEVKGGFDPSNVLVGKVTLPVAVYPEDDQKERFFNGLLAELNQLPGVVQASAASEVPLGRNGWTTGIVREGHEQDRQGDVPQVNYAVARPGWFSTLRIPLRSGRDFAPSDAHGGPRVAIFNQSAARLLWGGEEPIGKRFKFGSEDTVWTTVVGVVGDARQNARNKRIAEVYVPHTQETIQTLYLSIRTRGNPAALTPTVRQLVQRRDPDLPFYDAGTLGAAISKALWDTRLYAWMMGGYSLIALVIAAIGIYGVMAYRVAQRTQEIGIRMALGAPQSAVLRMVVGQGLRLTILGLGIGLAAAFALTRMMASLLFGVNPNDPPTFAGVAIILSLSALLASWLPAWRASRVDPIRALRHE